MVDQMVAGERVDPVVVAGEVRGRDGDELPIPGAPGQCGRPAEQPGCLRLDQGRCHEDDRIVAGFGTPEDDPVAYPSPPMNCRISLSVSAGVIGTAWIGALTRR